MDKPVANPAPPIAEQRPYSYECHAETIEDPWHWLRDPAYPKVEDEAVLAYLKDENAYFEAAMGPHKKLIEPLFEEMKGRVKEDESSVPIRDGDWLYWWAFKPGAQYRTWYRKPAAGGEDQAIFEQGLDVLSQGLRDDATPEAVGRQLLRISGAAPADADALTETFARLQALYRAGRTSFCCWGADRRRGHPSTVSASSS